MRCQLQNFLAQQETVAEAGGARGGTCPLWPDEKIEPLYPSVPSLQNN